MGLISCSSIGRAHPNPLDGDAGSIPVRGYHLSLSLLTSPSSTVEPHLQMGGAGSFPAERYYVLSNFAHFKPAAARTFVG